MIQLSLCLQVSSPLLYDFQSELEKCFIFCRGLRRRLLSYGIKSSSYGQLILLGFAPSMTVQIV
jgi:hypothetical protein